MATVTVTAGAQPAGTPLFFVQPIAYGNAQLALNSGNTTGVNVNTTVSPIPANPAYSWGTTSAAGNAITQPVSPTTNPLSWFVANTTSPTPATYCTAYMGVSGTPAAGVHSATTTYTYQIIDTTGYAPASITISNRHPAPGWTLTTSPAQYGGYQLNVTVEPSIAQKAVWIQFQTSTSIIELSFIGMSTATVGAPVLAMPQVVAFGNKSPTRFLTVTPHHPWFHRQGYIMRGNE